MQSSPCGARLQTPRLALISLCSSASALHSLAPASRTCQALVHVLPRSALPPPPFLLVLCCLSLASSLSIAYLPLPVLLPACLHCFCLLLPPSRHRTCFWPSRWFDLNVVGPALRSSFAFPPSALHFCSTSYTAAHRALPTKSHLRRTSTCQTLSILWLQFDSLLASLKLTSAVCRSNAFLLARVFRCLASIRRVLGRGFALTEPAPSIAPFIDSSFTLLKAHLP